MSNDLTNLLQSLSIIILAITLILHMLLDHRNKNQ